MTLIFVSVFLTSIGMISHNAFADTVISDQSSCNSFGGIWYSTTNTCNIDPDFTLSTLSCSGIILQATHPISVGGILDIKPDCIFDDHGFTVSNGTIINEGTFNNFGGVEVTNIFNNTGTFNNNNTFENYGSGFPTTLTNSGTLNNYYFIGNTDIVNNLGIINNKIGGIIEDRELISNKMDGTINNDGAIYILPSLAIGSDPPFYFYGFINNYGSINNNADGTIYNESTLNNECGGTIINNGTISGNQTVNISCQPDNTTTVVSLNPSTINSGEQTIVTANVTDVTSLSNTPTGTTSFSDNDTDGSFGFTSCNINSNNLICVANYTAPTTAKSVTIMVTYTGDQTHALSSGTATLTVNSAGSSDLNSSSTRQDITAQATQNLIDMVNGMNLKGGITNSLDSKLDALMNSITSDNSKLATNQINSFINEVNAQTGKSITTYQASQLIDAAQNISRSKG